MLAEQVQPGSGRSIGRLIGAAVLLLLFAVVLVRTAWLCDDAFITLRVCDNWLNGFGLRWNVAERVQAYTHPLWMLCLSGVYALTGELPISTMVFAMLVSLLTVGLLMGKVASSPQAALVAWLALILSKSFVDYSTSGLEDPLTHLLIVGFVALQGAQGWTGKDRIAAPAAKGAAVDERQTSPSPRPSRATEARGLGLLTGVFALMLLNRLDTALLLAPALAGCYAARRGWKRWAIGLLGLAPLFAWEAFAVVYYGSPVPNTAFAKLGTGEWRDVLIERGVWYLATSLIDDPMTWLTLLVGVGLTLFRRQWRAGLYLIGIVAYIAYVVYIGGDFMMGRMFTAPLVLAVCLLARHWRPLSWPAWGVLAVGAAGFALAATPCPSVISGAAYGADRREEFADEIVVDERAYYYPQTGLLHASDSEDYPDHEWAEKGRALRAAGRPQVMIDWTIGMVGFFAGPEIHIVDCFALADPLLARLPAQYPVDKPGHAQRWVPPGYLNTLETGKDHFTDPDVARLFEIVSTVTRGPLWSSDRLREAWRLNTGYYDGLVDFDRYRFPEMERLSPADLAASADVGGHALANASGLEIDLGGRRHAPRVRISLSADDQYLVILREGPRERYRTRVGPGATSADGPLATYAIDVPADVQRSGYTAIHILPWRGEGDYRVGNVGLAD